MSIIATAHSWWRITSIGSSLLPTLQSAVGGHTTPPKAAAPWADLQRLCTRLPCCAEHPSPPAA